ncbi:MAG TPA: curli assembly protein CsgF [Allosphingosinicella sp.]|nr:curli assembly protein CsgF [Allosphingosinicella sp.]
MFSRPQPGLRAAKRLAATLLAGAAFFAAGPASAQELVHTFTNPSFGGNPFYSEHLLATANIHRPDEPEEPSDPPPSEEELLASQLRSQFLSQLSGEIRRRIQTARPGDTGTFELGDQRISFVRTATETQITFLNTRTGETRRVVIPAGSNTDPFGATPAQMAAAGQVAVPLIPGQSAPANRQVSAEQALGAIGATTGRPGSSLSSGLLDPRSLELPLRGN